MKKTNPGLCLTIGFILLCAVCATAASNPAEDAQTAFQRGLTALSQNNYVDIRNASGSRVGYIDGDTIRNASGSRVGYIDGSTIRDASGSRIGYIDGSTIRDASGSRIGYIDGSTIRDTSGNRIGYTDGNGTRIQTGAAGFALLKIFR
jgi:hypothetical protein